MAFEKVSELCDVISIALLCIGDNTLLVLNEDNEYCLPYIKIPTGVSYENEMGQQVKDLIGVELRPERTLRIYKVWVPNHPQHSIFHTVFEIKCTMDHKRKSKNVGTGKVIS